MYDRLSRWTEQIESKIGQVPAAVVTSLFAMILAGLYVRPAVKTVALGALYSRMAEDPFTFIEGNYVAFRVLTPLISWVLGLRGELIVVTNLLAATALLILVYVYFRRRGFQSEDSLVVSLVLALTLPTLTTIYYGGYTDSVTYVIVFLMWWFRRNLLVFFSCLFLGLLNRESIVFLLPWFTFLQLSLARSKFRWVGRAVIGYVIVFGLFYVYRQWMSQFGEVPFTTMYYLGPILDDPLHWFKRSYPESWIGVFSVFKVLWIVPVAAGVAMWCEGDRRQLLGIVLLFLCVYAQLAIAFDSSRMITLAFMVMPVSLAYLFQHEQYQVRRWIVPLIIFNLFVPQLYTAAHIIEFMHSVPARLFQTYVLGNPAW